MLQKVKSHSWQAASLALLVLFSMAAMAAAPLGIRAANVAARTGSGPDSPQVRAVAKADATPQPSAQPARTAPPLSLTLTLLVTCCSVGLVVGVIVLAFILAMSNRKAQGDPPPASPPPS